MKSSHSPDLLPSHLLCTWMVDVCIHLRKCVDVRQFSVSASRMPTKVPPPPLQVWYGLTWWIRFITTSAVWCLQVKWHSQGKLCFAPWLTHTAVTCFNGKELWALCATQVPPRTPRWVLPRRLFLWLSFISIVAWVLQVLGGTHSQSSVASLECQGGQFNKSDSQGEQWIHSSQQDAGSLLWTFHLPHRRKTPSFSSPHPRFDGGFVSSLSRFYFTFKCEVSLFLKYDHYSLLKY